MIPPPNIIFTLVMGVISALAEPAPMNPAEIGHAVQRCTDHQSRHELHYAQLSGEVVAVSCTSRKTP